MKLANEIAKTAKDEFGWINADGYSDKELEETVCNLASIIAAKLEPLRAAFAEWMEAVSSPGFDNLRRVDARRRAEAALAMLSDEN